MLDTEKLVVLRAVVRHGSIAAAARELGYTRSAVSQQMTALERSAGVSLLIRGGNTVTVTPLGERLLEHTERILVELRAAEATLRQSDGVSGRIRIGIPFREGPAIMSTALTLIRKRYPELEITLRSVTDLHGAEQVVRGHLDMVILSAYGASPPLPESGLRQWILSRDPLRVCTPAKHELATLESCTIDQLRDQPLILCHDNPLGTLMHGLCTAAGFRPQVAATVQDVATALGLVGVGWGVTIAPELTPATSESSLRRVPLAGVTTQRYSVMICRDGEQDLPEVAAVVAAAHKTSRIA